MALPAERRSTQGLTPDQSRPGTVYPGRRHRRCGRHYSSSHRPPIDIASSAASTSDVGRARRKKGIRRWISIYLSIYINTHIHAYIYITRVPTTKHTYIHTHMHTYSAHVDSSHYTHTLHPHTPTLTNTHMHTYIFGRLSTAQATHPHTHPHKHTRTPTPTNTFL